mmetsp:Transcript_34762/g.67619  ORF Transcript_34762/g.67619 Transcript_34762/m.67619 type:complete len:1314 (-) Transcript_34762:589-4530(-)
MADFEDDSSSDGSDVPVRRVGGGKPQRGSAPAPKPTSSRKKEKKAKPPRRRQPRKMYKPPAARTANPEKVRYERQKEKERIAEFTRNYDDESDEDRGTLRRERISELRSRLAKLEGNGRPRGHTKKSKSPSRRNRDSRRKVRGGIIDLHGRGTGRGRNRTGQRERSRNTGDDIASLEDGAKLLLSKTARQPAPDTKTSSRPLNPGPSAVVACKSSGTANAANSAYERSKPHSPKKKRNGKRKTKQTQSTARKKGNVLFSLFAEYNREGSAVSAASRTIEEAASSVIPVKGQASRTADESDATHRRRIRREADHQKLFDMAKQMEERLSTLSKQGWGDTAAEAATLRSDLRDVYVDIVMRQPTYALSKKTATRVWMTYYREILHVKRTARGESGRTLLLRLLNEAGQFFRGFLECVCVRFDLYPPEAEEASQLEGGPGHAGLRDFMVKQYGAVDSDVKRTGSVARIVAELYIALGDLERYRTLCIKGGPSSKQGAAVMERARVLYKLAAATCPGYGKAHNQLAMVAAGDELEIVFQYFMSIYALEPFPGRENLIAAFESSRRRYEAHAAKGGRKDALSEFAILLSRLSGILFTKIGMEAAGPLFARCVAMFQHCLEKRMITDGVLVRVAIICIVLAQKGRLPHNIAFYDANSEGKRVCENGSVEKSRLMASGDGGMSVVTLRALDLAFEIFGAAANAAALNLKKLKFLAPVAAFCTWLQKNPFVVKESPPSDRLHSFLTSLARLANASATIRKSTVAAKSATVEVVSGFAPLGSLPEFTERPRTQLLPLKAVLKDSNAAASSIPKGKWLQTQGCLSLQVSKTGHTVSSAKLARWQTISGNVPLYDSKERKKRGTDCILLDEFTTADNNYGAVIGVIPEDFPEDAKLPIGWKIPGWGVICGTGELLGGEGSSQPYTEPFQSGDEIGVRFSEENNGTIVFTRNGKALGNAFANVGTDGTLRLAISLVKTQKVRLVSPGSARREAAAKKVAAAAERMRKNETKQLYGLSWQIRAVRRAADAVLYRSKDTKRFLAVAPFDGETKEVQEAAVHDDEDDDEDKAPRITEELKSSHRPEKPPLDAPHLPLRKPIDVASGGVKGVVVGADLVAMARARAARARAESNQTQLVEQIMTASKRKGDSLEAKGASGGVTSVQKPPEKPLLILDLPNICMRHGQHKRFSCAGIQLCIDHFRKRGFKKMVAFVPEHLLDYDNAGKHAHLLRLGFETADAAKTKLPDNISLLLSLKEEGYVVATPPQDYDDSYCISYAHKHNGVVVTNDKYRDCKIDGVTWDWLKSHLMTFTFVDDEFMPNPDFKFPA